MEKKARLLEVKGESSAAKKMKPSTTEEEENSNSAEEGNKIKKTILLRQTRDINLDPEDRRHFPFFYDDLSKIDVPAYEMIEFGNEPSSSSIVVSSYDFYDEGSDFLATKYERPQMVKMLPYPRRQHFTSGFANAVWKSHLFFISGQPACGYGTTHSVLSFDTQEQTWVKKWKPIQKSRLAPISVVVGNCIYVFGNVMYQPISKDRWGERFDITQNQWKYLPSPPRRLHKLQIPSAFALYQKCRPFTYTTRHHHLCTIPENQNLIFFPLPNRGSPISIFNCDDETWLPDLYPNLPSRAPPIFPHDILTLRDRLAIIDGVLLWHHNHAIHGYDFINLKFLPKLYKFPPERTHKCLSYYSGEPLPDRPPMFFVQPEQHKLFFIFQYECDAYTTHCYEFLVQLRHHGQAGPRLSLVCQSYSPLSTKSMNHKFLQDVLLL